MFSRKDAEEEQRVVSTTRPDEGRAPAFLPQRGQAPLPDLFYVDLRSSFAILCEKSFLTPEVEPDAIS